MEAAGDFRYNSGMSELRELAVLFLRLGVTAFGGPAAHIAMMEDEVVRRRRWLTHAEFLDLIRFLSELGKPGPYAVPNDPVVRRWRVLDPVPEALAGADVKPPPAGDAGWWPAYSLVSGVLPADALGTKGVGYARSLVDVTTPGKVKLLVDSPKGLTLWVDDRPAELAGPETVLDLSRGVHTLTVRVDPAAHAGGLRVQFADAPGSAGHVQPVSGK